MSVDFIADLANRALWITLLVSAPILGLGLAVGVAVSIFQSSYTNSRNDFNIYS